jgi:hypothetical protein
LDGGSGRWRQWEKLSFIIFFLLKRNNQLLKVKR